MTSGTTTWPNDPFAVPESRPALSFANAAVGTVKSGVVASIDTDVQGRNIKTGEPDTWESSGTPRLSIVIGLDTDEGPRSLWVTKYTKDAKFQAVKAAQEELGRVLQVGDTLKIAFTGEEPSQKAGFNRKLYKVKIEPGAVGGSADPFAGPGPGSGQADDVPF